MLSLENKTIVITGASSGIGQQCAISCSKLGARLILFGRNIENINRTLSFLKGDKHLFYVQDLSDVQQFELSIKDAVLKLGCIDGFIHSAGIQNTLPLRMHTKEVFSNQFDINALSGFEACRILTKKGLFNSKGGSIVFISSIRGITGAANLLGYSASKGAVIAGTKALAIEIAHKNIRVNTISPGMVKDTPMTNNAIKKFPEKWLEKNMADYPLGWVETTDVANACIFLLADVSKKITGINLVVDGGFSAK
jgi:Dehydrogenases with different specificities (related to short-chain alcohol dehydrogenases)